jgi:hypothetical protein
VITLTVTLDGLAQIRKWKNLKPAIARASQAFMRAQGKTFLQYAVEEAPVGREWASAGGFHRPGHPGLLQRSHLLRVVDPFNAEVVNTAFYALFVAGGTQPHTPPASSGLPWPVRRAIGRHGTRANPWMDRAFQRGLQDVPTNLDALGMRVMQELL